jgi:hypothetical protein
MADARSGFGSADLKLSAPTASAEKKIVKTESFLLCPIQYGADSRRAGPIEILAAALPPG